MRTDTLFGESDRLYQVFQRSKLYTGQSQATGYLVDHPLILGGSRLRILVEVLLVVALEILDDTAGNQFQIALRRRETDERATLYQRRT